MIMHKTGYNQIEDLPEWLIAESVDGQRQFIVHTAGPRFIGEIFDNDQGGNDIDEFEFIDELPRPLDAAKLATLMRRAGDALNEYDFNIGVNDE